MKKFVISIVLLILSINISGQVEFLQSGPMVGYSTMKEALLWVQTNKPATVHFEYWNCLEPNTIYKTLQVTTSKDSAFIARLLADQLEPGNQYAYELFINDTKVSRPYRLEFESQSLWQWRHDAPDFSFATGSCAYISEEKYDRPGIPYGGDYQIFEDIYEKDPDFMLWLGDNTYLREADWNSKTGIHYRYTHTRSTEQMQAMLGSMHHYAIWDDHDYGPNNSDRSYPMKKVAEETFKLFFANPNFIFEEGITGSFQWADCEFFLLDNRFWRTPNNRSDVTDPQIIGDAQMEWLLDAMINSFAPFKFVVIGGQFINPMQSHEKHANIAPKERLRLIKAIEKLRLNGVIFLTGDVHHTELSKLNLENGYPLYDLTVSPLTSGVAGINAEDNPLQVSGTLVKKRTYAHINVFGSREKRALKITVYDSNGTEQWNKEIKASDLKFQEEE